MKSKVYYDRCDKETRHNKRIITEQAKIVDAYFGRYGEAGPFTSSCPIGLNLKLDHKYMETGAAYTSMRDIEGIMNDFNVNRVEELKGKKVVAHVLGIKLLGISAH